MKAGTKQSGVPGYNVRKESALKVRRVKRSNLQAALYCPIVYRRLMAMRVFTAILEPHKDGSLHLPLPAELRGGKVRVEGKLEAVTNTPQPRFGCLAGKIRLAPDFDAPLDDFKPYME